MQLLCHLAALELLLGYLRALLLAAGVEVVAVSEGGADAAFRAEGFAMLVGGVVLADVEAASQRVGANLIQDKASHRSLVFIRIVGDSAFDEAVGDLNRGVGGYSLKHACSFGCIPTTAPRDVHVADAAREGGGAQGCINHSGQAGTLRRNLSLGAQVADGGVLHSSEGGYFVIFARIPVELQRMSLPVERAGVSFVIAHHQDFGAEVDVSRHLGINGVLSVVHEVAERLPVFLRGDVEGAGHGYVHALVFRYGRVGGEVDEVERVSHLRVVARAEEFLCRGQTAVDALSAVGIARGAHIVLVGEVHLTYFLCRVGGKLRLVVGAEGLSPHLRLSALLQLIGYVAVPELRLGDLIALRFAAGVEVVAVVEGGGGFGVRVRGKGVAAGGVVLADVEAVGQGAFAILATYKSAHAFLAFLRRGVELALDDAVGDGSLGILSYAFNHARRVASLTSIATYDIHVADAARDGGGAIGVVNQS